MKTYFRLLSFAKPLEKFAIPYILTTLLYIIFSTLNLTLLSPLFDTLLADGNEVAPTTFPVESSYDVTKHLKNLVVFSIDKYGLSETLLYVCITIAVSAFLSNFFRYFSQRFMEDLRVHTLLNLRKSVFNNVMNLDVGYFNNERKGDIISKVASDVQVVQFSVTNTLQVVFKEPATMIFYMVILISISPQLTLFSLLVIPISAFAISKIVKRLKKQATTAQESFAKMIGFLDEALSGIKIIKAFNATFRIKEKFQKENVFFSNINRKIVRRQQLASPVSEFLGIVMVAIIVWYGGTLMINKEADALTVPAFIGYIAIFSQIMRPAKALTDSFSTIHTGIAAGERVLELIDTKPTLIEKDDAKQIKTFNEQLIFKNVSFKYNEKLVLNRINFEVNKGEVVALVGPSGGGKSTIMDLIPRFYDPISGDILIDGLNLKEANSDSLRALMGIINQESFLFNDTIYNNIAFSNPNATPEEVMNAAKIANAHDFIIQTENGYDTFVGDRGNKLSGGQKQRLCIARAVLSNPPILLMDEATSALDTESEKLVQHALNHLMKNRTSIIIAHRLSTIQHADKIIVIENGEIVEVGSHAELIKKEGLYHKLISMQAFTE